MLLRVRFKDCNLFLKNQPLPYNNSQKAPKFKIGLLTNNDS